MTDQLIIPAGCCRQCNTMAPLMLVGADYLCRTCMRRKADELLKVIERYLPNRVDAYCKDYQCEYKFDYLQELVNKCEIPATYKLQVSSIGNVLIAVTLKLRMKNIQRLIRAKNTIMNGVADSGMFATPSCMITVEIETEPNKDINDI